MGILSNARHERFAQGVAKGKSQHEAYIYAGYPPDQKPNHIRASAGTIARRPDVAGRIQELQAKQALRIGTTVDELVVELDEMLKLSKRVKNPSAGVGAILAKGKLLGLITDKVEMEGTIRKPSATPTDRKQMTMDEWRSKYAPGGGGKPN